MLEFLWVKLTFLGWGFPSSTFCKAGFVAMCCLNVVLSWNILFPPLMVIEKFAVYKYLCLHVWSPSVYSIFAQDLLAFLVSIKKSGVILIGLPLYVT